MKQITLRGVPESVAKAVKKEAEGKGLSLNKAFIALLERSINVGKAKKKREKAVYHDLDHLSGAWSKNDAQTFNRRLKDQRKIDEGLWKATG